MTLAVCLPRGYSFAQDNRPPSPPFDDMYHSSWTLREGVPPGLWQAKQTTDGFLWLASETGLYRFDGIEFAKYHPSKGQHLLKNGPVTALTPTMDGGLWIAYRFGGASFIRQGDVTNYPANHGFPETVFILVQDKDGFLWGATSMGLARFNGDHWSPVSESWGPRIARVDHLKLAPNGDLWVDDGKTYYVLPRGKKQFQATGLPNGKIDLTSEKSGWLSRDDVGLFQILRSPEGTWSLGKQVLKENISSINHTADGSLWFGAHDGIWRVRNVDAMTAETFKPDVMQSIRKTEGLTADFVYALTVDREGSTWAITPNGLDQFRRTVFSSVALPPDLQHPFLVNEGKTVLVGSGFRKQPALVRVSATGIEPIPTPFLGIHQMYRDATGTVWINSEGKLWRMVGSTVTPIVGPKDISSGELKARAITMDKAGVLWISVVTNGPDKIYKLSQGNWTRFEGLDNSPVLAVTSMMTDQGGRIWLGTGSSHIYVVEGTTIHSFDQRQGIDSGGITFLQEQSDHVWIGGTENLDYFSNSKFLRVTDANGSAIAGVTGVAETSSGDIWLNSAKGALRITAAEMQRALHSDKPQVQTKIFNYLDGYFETPIVRIQASTVANTEDGRLYFLGRQGLVWVEPSHLEKNLIPPGVFITSATIDGHTYDNPSSLDLPQGSQNLQINYTATSLLVPARVQFRYKLEGFDKDWQEVETRRQAFYPRLPPGRYTFLVAASNNDGVWSTAPARWAFQLPPTFLQSVWFKLLCAFAFAVLLTGLYLFRVKLLTAQIKSRLFERLAERERIARDLHDTFFQGIQGLFLRFNTGTAMLSPEEPARQIFLEALEQSDRVMSEGRELVLDLRADEAMTATLAEDLARVGEQPSNLKKPDYKVFAVGQVRRLHPVCGTELLRIGQEAVYNAFRHANAAAVEVEVLYEKEFLKMRIRDDGQGIDEHVIRDGRRPGHLGLVGMNERAIRIGAKYSIWSKKGRGTEIEVEVPARIAYATANGTKQSVKQRNQEVLKT